MAKVTRGAGTAGIKSGEMKMQVVIRFGNILGLFNGLL